MNLLHDNTASLFQLAHDLRKNSVDHLFHGILLLLLLVVLLLLSVVRLLVMRLLSGVLVLRWITTVGGHLGRSTGQVDVDPSGVLLGGILEAEFLTDLFDAGLELLDMVCRVIAFSDDSIPIKTIETFVSRCTNPRNAS